MSNEWYRQMENRIIGSIDKEIKKRKERKGEDNVQQKEN
jgi:hypothetical protein